MNIECVSGGIGRRYRHGNNVNRPCFWAARAGTKPFIGADMLVYAR